MYEIFRFFVNFVSSCARYVHDNPMCTGYVPGLQNPNRTITHVGTTIIRMTRGITCIDNAPDTSSMAMSRTFRCCHREKSSEGSVQSPHWVPQHR
jgi:hypothetical protein